MIPSVLPTAPAGRGLTPAQVRRRVVSRALAEAGYVEVLPFPFVGPGVWDAFGLPADGRPPQDRARAQPARRRPRRAGHHAPSRGLLDTLVRNRSRGLTDLALYAVGQVVLPHRNPVPMPEPGVDTRPSDDEIAQIKAALPAQPVHVGVVLAGDRESRGWWGAGRAAGWQDAVQSARLVGEAAGVELTTVAADLAPWHPGRCAQLRVGNWPVGHAGELHPKVVEALGAAAAHVRDGARPRPAPRSPTRARPRGSRRTRRSRWTSRWSPVPGCPPRSWPRPCSTAAVSCWRTSACSTSTPASRSARGKRSLAYTLRFRAPDRTLTNEEANAARDAAVAVATERHQAVLRG